MYVLIQIGQNDSRRPILVSKTKTNIESYLKAIDYYWSKKHNRYVDDKNCGVNGGSGIDYIVEEIVEL